MVFKAGLQDLRLGRVSKSLVKIILKAIPKVTLRVKTHPKGEWVAFRLLQGNRLLLVAPQRAALLIPRHKTRGLGCHTHPQVSNRLVDLVRVQEPLLPLPECKRLQVITHPL
jgi:hypothetical protein